MKLDKVKKIVERRLRISGAHRMPEDELLADYFQEAMVYMGMRCEPNEMLCDANADLEYTVLRNLDNGYFIRMPEYPDFNEDRHLLIDEGLSYACINYVCFLITGDDKFRLLQDEFILRNQQATHMVYLGDDNGV